MSRLIVDNIERRIGRYAANPHREPIKDFGVAEE
jgi:hypothetical protein